MIGIINIGIGNPKSISNAFKIQNIENEIVSTTKDVHKYKKLVLPGVGHFGSYVRTLKNLGFYDYLKQILSKSDIPFLGICVGSQILLDQSHEDPFEKGLGLISGEVKQIEATSEQKVPNVGWRFVQNHMDDLDSNLKLERFYFSHSYAMETDTIYMKSSIYGTNILASIQKENLIGVQFHPEKSGISGLKFLKMFSEMN